MGVTKRKRTIKSENSDNSDTSIASKKLKPSPAADSKVTNKKGPGRPVKTDGAPAYTDEQDTFLANTIRNQGDKKNWKEVARLYAEKFPESKKSQDTLRMRYNNVLKGNDVELDDGEKEVFKRAVDDIQKQRITHEAIAWRYNQLLKEPKDPSKPMTKTGVVKLMKAMKGWSLDPPGREPTTTTTPESNDEGQTETTNVADGESKSSSKTEKVRTGIKIKNNTKKKEEEEEEEEEEEVEENENMNGEKETEEDKEVAEDDEDDEEEE